MSSSVASAPSLRVMQATTSWSRRGSGTPTTRASFTGAQARSCTSSSAGDTLAPPVLIISVRRPVEVDVAVGVDGAGVAGVEEAVGVEAVLGRLPR